MKKVLSIVIAMAMTLSLLTLGAAAKGTYSDTQGTWAEAAIERWSGYGMIQGNNGKFDPNGDLTRGQMATMLTRLLKLAAAESAGFSDITDETWCADAVNRCAAAGIMLGNNGKAMPNAPITRQEAMVMLARALGVAPITDTKALTKFADADKVGTFAQGYLAALVEAGIVKGTAEGKLDPLSNITRAETVAILNRVLNRAPQNTSDLLNGLNTFNDVSTTSWYYLDVEEAANSHTYTRKTNDYEYWEKLISDPSWL